MKDVFEFMEGDFICFYELIDDDDCPLSVSKKFKLIGKLPISELRGKEYLFGKSIL